jgi:hypothetical protein
MPATDEYCLSKKAKKTEGLEQHKKLQREKDQKRKARKQVSLPSKHSGKGKKKLNKMFFLLSNFSFILVVNMSFGVCHSFLFVIFPNQTGTATSSPVKL